MDAVPVGFEARYADQAAAVSRTFRRMIHRYVPGPYHGPVTLFASADGPTAQSPDSTLGWQRVAEDLRVVRLPGDHTTCVTKYADELARQLQACIDAAQA